MILGFIEIIKVHIKYIYFQPKGQLEKRGGGYQLHIYISVSLRIWLFKLKFKIANLMLDLFKLWPTGAQLGFIIEHIYMWHYKGVGGAKCLKMILKQLKNT